MDNNEMDIEDAEAKNSGLYSKKDPSKGETHISILNGPATTILRQKPRLMRQQS